MPAHVKVVGLTGGIGSGKSTVAGMFRALGATLIDADRLARAAVEAGEPAFEAIVARFGPGIVGPDGRLDRRALGRRVFQDEAERRALNAIVHPEVRRRTLEALAAAREAGVKLVIHDVPLLFENGLDRTVDATVVVHVSPETQRARIRARDPLDDDEIEARIAAQIPLDEKADRADHVIDNEGPLEATRRQVEALYARWTS